MPERMPRSLVVLADVGGPSYHVGDEAMLAANLGMLRREAPSAHLNVLGRVPGADGDPQALAAAFEGATGLFLSGGGNLSSSWPGLLRQRILVLREARRRGLPVVTGGQTIGPALSPLERDGLTEALAGVARSLMALGHEDQARQVVDTAPVRARLRGGPSLRDCGTCDQA